MTYRAEELQGFARYCGTSLTECRYEQVALLVVGCLTHPPVIALDI
jgi:hypothetical protein